MTKGELFAELAHMPDDTKILFNITPNSENLSDNYDLKEVWGVMADSHMCPGYEGCTHTEPMLDNEIVIFITNKPINDIQQS